MNIAVTNDNFNKEWYQKRILNLESKLYSMEQRVNLEVNVSDRLQKEVLEFLKGKVSDELHYEVEGIFIDANFRGS
tara:strand:+ start:416 stop:643 length:228 start_codon:yes stop_codon:yes gene_type:complete